jgi:hypothetical protein
MYTYRIENEEGKIVVYLDINNNPFIHQPFNPEHEGFVDWSSSQEAEEWAIEKIDTFNNPTPALEKVEIE